jgi:hypothetical protein
MRDGKLYGRYTITHKDGKPIDPDRRYFVLSPDTDPHALTALMVYVVSCQKTHPTLAKSICQEYGLAIPGITTEEDMRAQGAE